MADANRMSTASPEQLMAEFRGRRSIDRGNSAAMMRMMALAGNDNFPKYSFQFSTSLILGAD